MTSCRATRVDDASRQLRASRRTRERSHFQTSQHPWRSCVDVPIIPEVRDIVLERIESARGRPDARLFVGPRGGRITTAVLRDATHWDEVLTALGDEHLRRHDLRHTGLTWMADAGVPVHVLRRIAGHGSLNTTQRYLHSDSSKVSAAGESLTAYLETPRVPNGSQLRSM
jgi:hypothetical protein